MALSDEMRGLTHELRASCDARMAAVADTRTAVATELGQFGADRKRLSEEQRRQLGECREALQ